MNTFAMRRRWHTVRPWLYIAGEVIALPIIICGALWAASAAHTLAQAIGWAP